MDGHQIHLISPKTAMQALLNAEARLAGKAERALDWFKWSGRVVRIKELGLEERDAVLTTAARSVGPEATIAELNRRRNQEGVKAMIVEVTRKGEILPEQVPTLKAEDWMRPNRIDFEPVKDGGKGLLTELFTIRDLDALVHAFRMYNDTPSEDIEAIVGKAVPVSMD